MRKTIQALSLYMVLLLLCPPGVNAADENRLESKPSLPCTSEPPYEQELFADVYKAAKTLCPELVKLKFDQPDVDSKAIGSTLKEFASKSQASLDRKELNRSANYASQFTALKQTFGDFDSAKPLLPEFKVESWITGDAIGYFEPLEQAPVRFVIKEVEQCGKISKDTSCKEIFQDFSRAFNPYRSAYNLLHDNTEKLTELGTQWDNFLEVSKSQSIVEVWLTTFVNYKHFRKDHLVGPPPYQIIALHPQLIYDSMDKAADGSNQEIGLAVEWLGVNFWDLKVPLGLSFTSIYVDRENVKDFGHGALLHINNHYAVGWARHGDEDSFYVTIDLLKMFADKKAVYDQYVKSYF